MEFKIYQDREKIADTGDINRDYRVLFPQTTTEAVHYKNNFTDNNLKSVLDYLVDTKSCVIVSEDKPTNAVGNIHWMKILGTYNNGTIGNIYLTYVLNHNLRNHDGTVVLNQTENVICKNGEIVTPTTKDYDGYLPETPSKVEISENGQVVECYYEEQQYNIAYVLNGGINSANNPSTIYYTEEFTLENATKSEYNFNGWYLDSGFTKKVTKLSKISNDITLYAKFGEVEYGITYVLDGGTNNSANPNTITATQTVTLADATKSGHTFNGWYLDSGFVTKVTTLTNVTSDITLYAKFTATSGGSIPGALIEDDGTTENSSTMTFTRLMPTSMGTIAQSSSGRWYGWGRNYNGTLQYRKNDSYFTSYAIESCKISPYADENANMRIDVASVDNCTYGNSAMSLVIDTNGNIWLLGKDEFGIDDSYSSCIDWTQISNNTKFTKVASCGYGGDGAEVFALMAIDKNGNIWMQGDNRFYLGDVNTTVQTTFFRELTQVTQGTKYIDVSLYNKYALMIDENNNLYQVGKSQCPSSSEEYREPTILMSGTKFKKVYCSIFTSAAITTDGTLYVWGRNIDGQLGNGNADDEVFAPIKYPISEKVKSVSIGYGVLFVLTENGNIYVSGENSYHGILGLGSVTQALTPTKVNVSETFIDLSFNTSTVVAIDSKGKLWEWGYYAYILGDPTDDVNVPQKAKFAIGTAE